MKKKLFFTFLLLLALFPILSLSTAYADDNSDTITIRDENLKKSLLAEMGKSSDDTITKEDMQQITELIAQNQDISSLEGLQYCTNLKTLDLTFNSITDISPIGKLTNLQRVKLSDQEVNLPEEKFTDTVSFKNPIIFLDGTPVPTLSKIDPNGTYNPSTNSLTWTSLNDDTTVAFSFSTNFTIGTAFTNFSGRVSKKVTYDNIVDIPDSKLKAAILQNLGKSDTDSVRESDMESITSLVAENQGISSIEGLQYCTNLKTLDLTFNSITDICPLTKLTNLEHVKLSDQSINLPEEKSTGTLTISNPIISLYAYPVSTLSKISNNGSYDPSTNSLTWTSLNRDTTVAFSFSTNFTIGKAFTNFSGRVSQDVIYCK